MLEARCSPAAYLNSDKVDADALCQKPQEQPALDSIKIVECMLESLREPIQHCRYGGRLTQAEHRQKRCEQTRPGWELGDAGKAHPRTQRASVGDRTT